MNFIEWVTIKGLCERDYKVRLGSYIPTKWDSAAIFPQSETRQLYSHKVRLGSFIPTKWDSAALFPQSETWQLYSHKVRLGSFIPTKWDLAALFPQSERETQSAEPQQLFLATTQEEVNHRKSLWYCEFFWRNSQCINIFSKYLQRRQY